MPSSCVLCAPPAAVPESNAPPFPEADVVPSTLLVRTTLDPRRLDTWTLVLSSKGLGAVVVPHGGVYELHVPWAERTRALRELAAADAEEGASARLARAEPASAPPATRRAWLGATAIALLLAAFYAVTGPRTAGTLWFARGASDAERVLHGEVYRTVTALTLHADAAHLVSNLGIGAFVIGAVQ
jgi:rhomboid protease GluP